MNHPSPPQSPAPSPPRRPPHARGGLRNTRRRSPGHLERWRTPRVGPAPLHIGGRVRYRRSAAETWLCEKNAEAAAWMASEGSPPVSRNLIHAATTGEVVVKRQPNGRWLAAFIQLRDIDGTVRSVRVADRTKGATTRNLGRRLRARVDPAITGIAPDPSFEKLATGPRMPPGCRPAPATRRLPANLAVVDLALLWQAQRRGWRVVGERELRRAATRAGRRLRPAGDAISGGLRGRCVGSHFVDRASGGPRRTIRSAQPPVAAGAGRLERR